VLTAPPTVPEKPDARPLAPGPGAVKFEHVTFGYDAAKPVLHDINFQIPGGSIVAVVGPTGGGKSTMVSLISRFYDPQKGRIFIDGEDVREVAMSSLRSQVSFVFQETYLFSDSTAGNIAYGSRTSRRARSKPRPGSRRRTNSSSTCHWDIRPCWASAAPLFPAAKAAAGDRPGDRHQPARSNSR